jgi:hypothetical protein
MEIEAQADALAAEVTRAILQPRPPAAPAAGGAR